MTASTQQHTRGSMHVQPSPFRSMSNSRKSAGFTILEVMIAVSILAVGFLAALGTIASNNTYQQQLNENDLADLVLHEMTSRLNTTSLATLGTVYMTPAGLPQGWTLHMRATASTLVAAASASASLNPPYNPPYPPLHMTDLLNAAIINAPVSLSQLSVYVEYYSLNTQVGLQNINDSLVPVYDGLIKHYDELQDANPTSTPQALWYSMVGNPNVNYLGSGTALSPTDSMAPSLIMPATFSTANTNTPGTPQQVVDANNHGVVIRVLISWVPASNLNNTGASALQWRETILVKTN